MNRMPGRPATWRLVIVGLAMIGLSGCVLFDEPLSDETTSEIDPRLVGRWRGEGQEEAFEITTVEGHPNLLRSVTADSKLDMFTTRIGDRRYLSIVANDEATGQRVVTIVEYEHADDGRIRMFGAWDKELIRRSIADGTLKGSERQGSDPPRSIRVTSDTRTLREFVQEHGQACIDRRSVTVLIPVEAKE